MHNWPGLPAGKHRDAPRPDDGGGRPRHDHRSSAAAATARTPTSRSIRWSSPRTSSPRRNPIVSRNVPPLESAVVSLCGDPVRQPGRHERDSGRSEDHRHGAHLQPRGAGSSSKPACARWSNRSPPASARPRRCTTSASTRPPSTPPPRPPSASRWPPSWSAPRTWCRTWSPAWAPRTSRSCCSSAPAPISASARPAAESACFLHNSRYDFNDDILPLGAALFARLAERSMPLSRGEN